jgi:3-hydroxyisobutyrate dehydrogenase
MRKVAWIGTGVMGRHMVGHLLKAGHKTSVFSRSVAKCAPLVERGAHLAQSPRDAAEGADFIFTMVSKPEDVDEVILGAEGVLAGAKQGSILVDMTTSKPSLAVTIAAWAAAQGVRSLDAPVSGGDIGAEAGTLSIMCGGPKSAFEDVMPLFELMGRNVQHMGPPGMGQHTKMSNQVCCPRELANRTTPLARPSSLDVVQRA